MAMKDFQVTVDFRGARTRGKSTAGIDIASLVGAAAPSAVVLAGDPTISVQVRVAEREQAQLRAAVKEFCIVEDYSELDLY